MPVCFTDAVERSSAEDVRFPGRASRSECWSVALHLGVIHFVLALLSAAGGTDPLDEPTGCGVLIALLLFVFAAAHIVPTIAVRVRRLHGATRSRWRHLVHFIPLVGAFALIVLLGLPAKPEGARFGR